MARARKPLPRETARKLLSKGQAIFFGLLLLGLACGIVFARHYTAIVCVAAALLFYTCFVGLKVVVWWAASKADLASTGMASVDDPDLPRYTLLVPLYKEGNVLRRLVKAIETIDYPKHLLQVLLLLEEDDWETRAEAVAIDLPDYFEVVLAPEIPEGADSKDQPRGKPRALNLGLAEATGTFCVIYDAEDRPEPDQLLKAVAAFRKLPQKVACVQARLAFWNGGSSWVSRFYWAEYVVHFEWVLAGLAKLDLIPPLGGTSNHFRTEALRQVAIPHEGLPAGAEGTGAWDPWNVTEDADLAGALAARGYKVRMIDSVTYEEAPAKASVADRQRRRWLKGFFQTGLTYTRRPLRTAREMGPVKWLCYVLTMLGTPISMLLNPAFWAVTVVYFATHTSVITRLFPLPLYYTGLTLMVAGNLLLFYQLVMACLKRNGDGGVKYMLLTPLWWLFTSWTCIRMFIELLRPSKRHVWHKTPHGHDMEKEDLDDVASDASVLDAV